VVGNGVFEDLVDLAQSSGITLGTAESVTGGELAHLIASQRGAGDVFAGGVVAYQTNVKQDLLRVPDGPVVSHPAAQAMAAGALRLLHCDLVMSITGVAGPDRQDGQPVGCVFIGLALRDDPVTSTRHFFNGSPEEIRHSAAVAAARLAHDRLRDLAPAEIEKQNR